MDQRVRIVACLVEGNSVRGTCRLTGAAKGTVLSLLADLGQACADWHHERHYELKSRFIQVDEIWSFVQKKDKTKKAFKDTSPGGSAWTWKAIDPESKFLAAYFVGCRGSESAYEFMHDLRLRLAHRVQLTSDGHAAYVDAVLDAMGTDVDFSQVQKQYDRRGRYIGCKRVMRIGHTDPKKISTSLVERSNLTLRMSNRRFARKSNAFSKKMENHRHAVALYAMHYNYCRPHMSLGGKTPAMAAGMADHKWSLEELVDLLVQKELAAIAGGSLKRGSYRKEAA